MFLGLDKSFGIARHFHPSLAGIATANTWQDVAGWWQNEVGVDWYKMRNQAMELLSEEDRPIPDRHNRVGPDALPDEQRLILENWPDCFAKVSGQTNPWTSVDAFDVQKQIPHVRPYPAFS